jgi:hypothetical protein
MDQGGVLVTFNAGIKDLATGELRGHLLLLKAP